MSHRLGSLIHRGILSETVLNQVFAHEIGHSLGAKHDDSDSACNPSRKDNYLMTGQSKVIVFYNFCIYFEVT